MSFTVRNVLAKKKMIFLYARALTSLPENYICDQLLTKYSKCTTKYEQ